jgi:hypothetical protein
MTYYHGKNGGGIWAKDEKIPADEAELISEFEHWTYWLNGLSEGYVRPLSEMFAEITKLTPMQIFAFASFMLDDRRYIDDYDRREVDRYAEVRFLREYAFERAYRANTCPPLWVAWEKFLEPANRRPEVEPILAGAGAEWPF